MVSHKGSQIYKKKYSYSVLSLFVLLYESRYDNSYFILALQTFHYRPIYFNGATSKETGYAFNQLPCLIVLPLFKPLYFII